MTTQTVQLKRSDKCYIAGIRAIRSRLNEEAKELDWLDKNIELIQQGRFCELIRLAKVDGR